MQGRGRSVGHLQSCIPALEGTEPYIDEQVVAGWTKATLYKHHSWGTRSARQYSFDLVEVDRVEELRFVESVSFVLMDMGEEEVYEDDEDFDCSDDYSE